MPRPPRTARLCALALTLAAASCGSEEREPGPPAGSLDGGFGGGDGFVADDGAAGGSGDDVGDTAILDGAGRVLVAGFSADAVGMLQLAVWRFTADGAPDATFGGDGRVTHPGAGAGGTDEQTVGTGLAVDSAGRVVACGYSIGTDKMWGVAVWRFLPGGEPDPDFDVDGFVRATSPQAGGVRCVVDASDRVVVAGFAWNGTNWDTAVWRFEADGDPDPTFGGTGLVLSDGAAGGSGEDIGVGVALDGQGRIVVAGYSTNAAGDQDATVWRYLPSGAPDDTFDTTGHVSHTAAAGGTGDDVAREVAFDVSGRLVVAGWSVNAAGDDDLAVWRFLPGGGLDPAFGGGDGHFTQAAAAGGTAGGDVGRGVAIDAAGRILVAGQSAAADGDPDLALWRLGADGTLDPSFGQQGVLVLDGSGGAADGRDGGRDVLVAARGRIVVTGFSELAAGNRVVALWRVNP